VHIYSVFFQFIAQFMQFIPRFSPHRRYRFYPPLSLCLNLLDLTKMN